MHAIDMWLKTAQLVCGASSHRCMLFYSYTATIAYASASGASPSLGFPKLTAKSYMPKNTAPPNEMATVLGTHPPNNARVPSVLAISNNLGGKDKTEGDCLGAPEASAAV